MRLIRMKRGVKVTSLVNLYYKKNVNPTPREWIHHGPPSSCYATNLAMTFLDVDTNIDFITSVGPW